jgi:hypothetical protein
MTVHLRLPGPCKEAFEIVLDYMYRFYTNPLAELNLLNLSAESALSLLWLAGRLRIQGLHRQVVEHLQGAMTVQSALEYVKAANRLDLVKVRTAALRLAAVGLRRLDANACFWFQLEAMAQLLGMAEAEGGPGMAAAISRQLASYLRAYDGWGRLDEAAYRRVTRDVNISALQHALRAASGRAGGRGEESPSFVDEEGIRADDLLRLRRMANRCADS